MIIPALSSASQPKFTIVNAELRRKEHVGCWIPRLREKSGDIIRMLGEQNTDMDFRRWRVKFMNGRKDQSVSAEGFSLVLKLDQKNLKVLKDSHHKVLHFFLESLKFHHIRKL